jgi:hypothetical protein
MKTIYCKESFWLCIFYFQHFSTFSQVLRQSFSPFGHFLRSVLFYFWSYSTLSHSTFCLSTFGHSMFGHSTFGHCMFGHSTFGHCFSTPPHGPTLVSASTLHPPHVPFVGIITLHPQHNPILVDAMSMLLLSVHHMVLSCCCYYSPLTWSYSCNLVTYQLLVLLLFYCCKFIKSLTFLDP